MKSISAAKKGGGKTVIRAGSVAVNIYRSETRGRPLFTIAYRDTGGRRVKKSFADFAVAKTEAEIIAAKIQSGQLDVLQLSSIDRLAYQHALNLLRPTGQPLESAAAQFAEAFQVLKGVGSVVEAARYFARHHPVALPHRTVPHVYEEFVKTKEADNASARYLEDIHSRLGRFAKRFDKQISELTAREIEEWIVELGGSAVTRNSFRALVITFFNFARQRGYLAKNQPTEAEGIAEAKEPPTKIGIFKPDQMAMLLSQAEERHVAYLAIGGFAGLRHAELMRLEWSNVKLSQGFIEVPAEKAKTAQRRIVPIQPNLAAWLQPFAKSAGVIFHGHSTRFLAGVTNTARRCGFGWPANGLRHSYASYRLAACKNVAEVAFEMGNSAGMIFKHYRELVSPRDAETWWATRPAPAEKIVQISA